MDARKLSVINAGGTPNSLLVPDGDGGAVAHVFAAPAVAQEIAKRWDLFPVIVEALKELVEMVDETLDPEAEAEFEGLEGDALRKYRELIAKATNP